MTYSCYIYDSFRHVLLLTNHECGLDGIVEKQVLKYIKPSTETSNLAHDGPVPDRIPIAIKSFIQQATSELILALSVLLTLISYIHHTLFAEETYLVRHLIQLPGYMSILTCLCHHLFLHKCLSETVSSPKPLRLNGRFTVVAFLLFIQLSNGHVSEFPQASIGEIFPTSKYLTLEDKDFNYTCIGCAENIFFSVNGTNVDQLNSESFYQYPVVSDNESNPCQIRRVLLVKVSPSINKSEVECTVYNTENNLSGNTSEPPAKILIENALDKPSNIQFIVDYITNQLQVFWDPPQTRFNTPISIYNVSSNVDIFNIETFMTSANFYFSSLQNCKEITFNISAYNGLVGKPAHSSINLSSEPITEIPVQISDVKYNDTTMSVELNLLINISNLCVGEFPTSFSSNISYENCSSRNIASFSSLLINVSDTAKTIEHSFHLNYTAFSRNGIYCAQVSFGNSAARKFEIDSRSFTMIDLFMVDIPNDFKNETNTTNSTEIFGNSRNGCSKNFSSHLIVLSFFVLSCFIQMICM